MMVIGLTGGIGSGKSTAANIFAGLGVCVVDTDQIARDIVMPGQPALNEIVEAFGKDLLNPDESLNRSKLKQIIFNNNESRKKLESILHPRIKKHMQQMTSQCRTAYCVAIIPLLVEQNWQDMVDRVLLIDTPQKLQIKRVRERDNLDDKMILSIIGSQANRDAKIAASDDIVVNDQDTENLKRQLTDLHQRYLLLAANHN